MNKKPICECCANNDEEFPRIHCKHYPYGEIETTDFPAWCPDRASNDTIEEFFRMYFANWDEIKKKNNDANVVFYKERLKTSHRINDQLRARICELESNDTTPSANGALI